MRKNRSLFFCGLLFLLCNFAFPSHRAQEPDRSLSNFDTVLSRRETLAKLIEERARVPSGDDVAIVRVLNRITAANLKLHDLDAALTNANDSLSLARRLGSSKEGELLADTIALSASVHSRREESAIARELSREALALSRSLKYRRGEAQSLLYLGTAYSKLSKHSRAGKCLAQALPIWRELQDRQGEGSTLIVQGEIYILLDQPAQATTAFRQAEAIWRSVGNSQGLAATLLDLNFLGIRQGQWQSALALLYEAQKLVTDPEAEPLLAGQIAMSFGEVYEAYGQLQLALRYFRESLEHYDKGAHDLSYSIDARNKVGRVMARLGDFAGAKETIEEGLRLADERKLQSDLVIGLSHEDLGRVYLTAELYEQARLQFMLALDRFKEFEHQRPWARTQSYLGQTEHLLGNVRAANRGYRRALIGFKRISDYTNEAALCFGVGKLALQQGRLKQAGKYLGRSIELTEGLRENAASKDLRSSFLASVHDRYETYVEYLMALHTRQPRDGLHIKAFEASENGRARALLDSLANYQKEVRQVTNPLLLFEEEELQKQEQELSDSKSRFVSGGREPKAIASIDKQLADVRSRYETLQARINSSAKFVDLLRPRPLSYESIKAQITDAETSLVEYSLGTGQSLAWVVTQDGITVKELPNKAIINAAARTLISLLNNPELDSGYEGRLQASIDEVSRLVWEPISSQLQTKRLIIVPDGILHYIPFQILSASKTARVQLIDSFEIVNTPSASTLVHIRQQRKDRQAGARLLIGFGDPRFSADNFSNAAADANQRWSVPRATDNIDPANLPRLFYSKRELRAIEELAGEDSEFYLEYAATRNNLLHADLSSFRILHLVTHGVFDATQPELSGLFLSRVDAQGQPLDGFVGLADIYKLHARLDLVVLSACHSALATTVRGEGRVGLTRGFMYAGASSVVASLWKVDDEAGAELMRQFYVNMLQRGLSPSAALRTAQMTIREQPHWRSPYFWAGFTFEGEYNQQILRASPMVGSRNDTGIKVAVLVVLLSGTAYLCLRWARRGKQSKTIQHRRSK